MTEEGLVFPIQTNGNTSFLLQREIPFQVGLEPQGEDTVSGVSYIHRNTLTQNLTVFTRPIPTTILFKNQSLSSQTQKTVTDILRSYDRTIERSNVHPISGSGRCQTPVQVPRYEHEVTVVNGWSQPMNWSVEKRRVLSILVSTKDLDWTFH